MTNKEIEYELKRLRKRVCCANQTFTGSDVQDGDGILDTYTIEHGLEGVTEDTFFVVTPTSFDASFIAYAIIDETEITIIYDSGAIPDAGSANLSWNWLIKL